MLALLDHLEPRARAAGGRMVTLLGNHEVLLLSGEVAARARGPGASAQGYRRTLESLSAGGTDLEHLLGPRVDLGRRLRRLPLAGPGCR